MEHCIMRAVVFLMVFVILMFINHYLLDYDFTIGSLIKEFLYCAFFYLFGHFIAYYRKK
ncbi:hypothetical protein [Prevotella sp. HUN102]|uniref:hypothetical protein n=1 Tax=Prevotella sp. HUN102 TaxID=1392486 RepID=UPI0012DFD2D2|nr:hypothetical protein [Prevotella sp. HUN102]